MPRRRSSSSALLFRRFTVVMLLAVGAYLAWYVVRRFVPSLDADTETSFRVYPGFGIALPENYAIHGIDVSRYQKRVNWGLVKKMQDGGVSISFAFVKATEGTTIVDEQFKRNWKKAADQQMVRGAYHFFSQQSDGHRQALYFIKHVKLNKGDLPPVLDVEHYNGDDLDAFLDEIAVWLRVVEDYYKVKPIIYSNAAFYNRYLHDRFAEYPLWVAHYLERRQPRVDRAWHFWQHSESGRVNGITAPVDFNVFNGSRAEFDALLVR